MGQYDYVRDEGAETLRSISRGLFPLGLRASEAIPANRFVTSTFGLGADEDETVVAVSLLSSNQYADIVAGGEGVRLVEAGEVINSADYIKCGDAGVANVFVEGTDAVALSVGMALANAGTGDLCPIYFKPNFYVAPDAPV